MKVLCAGGQVSCGFPCLSVFDIVTGEPFKQSAELTGQPFKQSAELTGEPIKMKGYIEHWCLSDEEPTTGLSSRYEARRGRENGGAGY